MAEETEKPAVKEAPKSGLWGDVARVAAAAAIGAAGGSFVPGIGTAAGAIGAAAIEGTMLLAARVGIAVVEAKEKRIAELTSLRH